MNNICYLCDKKQCANCSSETGFCYHTTKIEHAVNWNTEPTQQELEKYFSLCVDYWFEKPEEQS